MLVTLNVVSIIRTCMTTARTLNDVSGFDFGLTSRKVREKNFLFLAVFASETEIPLAGGKGAHFSSSISTSDNGREVRGVDVPALIRRDRSSGQGNYRS